MFFYSVDVIYHSPILFLQLSQPFRQQFHYGTYQPMNSFRINSVLVLVVVDLVYIYPLFRYPQNRCSLHHQNQSFQALYPGYLLSSIHLHLVCSPLPTYRLYLSTLPSAHFSMNQESTLTLGKMI